MLTICRHRLFLPVKPGRRKAGEPSGRHFAVRTAFSGGCCPPRSPPAKGILSLWNPIFCRLRRFLSFFTQHPQPQPLLLSQPHPQLLPQPLKSRMKRRMRRIMHQLLFPSKHELHIIKHSLKFMMYLKRFCRRFIVHSMLRRKKCYKKISRHRIRLLSQEKRGIIYMQKKTGGNYNDKYRKIHKKISADIGKRS